MSMDTSTINIMAACDRCCERLAVYSARSLDGLDEFARDAFRGICELKYPPDRLQGLRRARGVLDNIILQDASESAEIILLPLDDAIRLAEDACKSEG
jgi:hypothetical protein